MVEAGELEPSNEIPAGPRLDGSDSSKTFSLATPRSINIEINGFVWKSWVRPAIQNFFLRGQPVGLPGALTYNL
jgi:hypothetical protein